MDENVNRRGIQRVRETEDDHQESSQRENPGGQATGTGQSKGKGDGTGQGKGQAKGVVPGPKPKPKPKQKKEKTQDQLARNVPRPNRSSSG